MSHVSRLTSSNRLRENYCGTGEIQWSPRLGQQENTLAGCSKWHPSKAAGSSATEAYPWGTLQGDGRLRTKLGERRVSARRGWAGEKIDFFSILLEEIADQLDRLLRRDSGMDEMRREIFEQAHPGLVGPQQNHGLLCLQRQRNF